MKKLRMMLLCAVMVVIAAGCKESTEWIEEDAAKISDEVTSGEFVLEGTEFSFPMTMEYWLDNGWHISNNYQNKDKFLLEPGNMCEPFELFRDDDNKQYVRVVAYNDGTEDAKLKDCKVYSVEIDLEKNDAVFPQGITKRSSEEEILDAYGNDGSKAESKGYDNIRYFLDSEELGLSYVQFDVLANTRSKVPLETVTYSLMDFDQTFELLKDSEGVEKACEIYFNAEENTYFYGDVKDYVKYSLGSEAFAKENYEMNLEYYAAFLCGYLDITAEFLTDEHYDRLIAVAKEALGKVKWEVVNVDTIANKATMTMNLYPTDLLYVANDDIFEAMDEYTARYADVDFENMSDEEYIESEDFYTNLMITALEKNVNKAGALDAVEYEFDIDTDTFEISEEDWAQIDEILMDAVVEEE